MTKEYWQTRGNLYDADIIIGEVFVDLDRKTFYQIRGFLGRGEAAVTSADCVYDSDARTTTEVVIRDWEYIRTCTQFKVSIPGLMRHRDTSGFSLLTLHEVLHTTRPKGNYREVRIDAV